MLRCVRNGELRRRMLRLHRRQLEFSPDKFFECEFPEDKPFEFEFSQDKLVLQQDLLLQRILRTVPQSVTGRQ